MDRRSVVRALISCADVSRQSVVLVEDRLESEKLPLFSWWAEVVHALYMYTFFVCIYIYTCVCVYID